MVLEYENKFGYMLSNTNTEFSSLRDRFTKIESQLLVIRRVNNNVSNQNRFLERKCAANKQYSRRENLEIFGIPDSVSNNNLDETVLKFFSQAGVTIDSRDVKACHRLNQPVKKGDY